ncbi:alpha/beta hydrolase family protein [Ferrimonas lipolytica]|uniref:S9 family peptidase n=1 Tax=Ferrimonas lipolytica TaxID=2724191 RepID=A0A6H1UDN5_9GAMM|nr:prolyl oligopeptidase family serine peptidase [Ferrimonas lipolytica]QIZ75912.1 S9 family peptidase [Ferrimonas lipolytica]
MMVRIILLLVSLLAVPLVPAETQADISYFTQASSYNGVKISPKGTYLAIRMPKDGQQVVAILETKTMAVKHIVRFGNNKEVGQFHWGNDNRLLVSLSIFKGWLAGALDTGEWYAVNADGSKDKYIFGYRGGGSVGVRVKKQESRRAWGSIIDLLPEDDDYVLMASQPMSRTGERLSEILKVNIYNGQARELGRSPIPNAYFLADKNGDVRFIAGERLNGKWDVRYRDKRGDQWQTIDSEGERGGTFKPLAFAGQHHVYALSNLGGDINGIYKMDVRDGSMKLLFKDNEVDPSDTFTSPDGRDLYAILVEPDFPNYVFIDGEHPSAKVLKSLMASFPGKQVQIASETLDGMKAVVAVRSDQQPVSFFLFDKGNNQLRPLVESRSWVDERTASLVEPIKFTARDGKVIQAYLTLPPGLELSTAKKLPMVVNPHGGPHGIRDRWGYNYETQLLASHGYAVLQVNFRGSGGFGRAFEQAGYRQWGGVSQFDIIDGTQYVVGQGIADPKRMCIYGASFGGYSALQSSILEPDLFQCAVGSMGVYDLEMMFDNGDIQTRRTGINYLNQVLGDDKAQLQQYSPVNNVDKLKVALMLIHGEEDERVPVEQVEALRVKLDKISYPYQYMEMDKEGHSLADPETRQAYYQKIVGFLDQHLQL